MPTVVILQQNEFTLARQNKWLMSVSPHRSDRYEIWAIPKHPAEKYESWIVGQFSLPFPTIESQLYQEVSWKINFMSQLNISSPYCIMMI